MITAYTNNSEIKLANQILVYILHITHSPHEQLHLEKIELFIFDAMVNSMNVHVCKSHNYSHRRMNCRLLLCINYLVQIKWIKSIQKIIYNFTFAMLS